jgi:spore coat protein CotH
MKTEYDHKTINELWQEHLATPFPKRLRGKDINGIDFVMLDADIAGCVSSFLEEGKLNLYQTAMLGLSYQRASHVVSLLSDEEAAYYERLERLAELVLKAIALDNEAAHKKGR